MPRAQLECRGKVIGYVEDSRRTGHRTGYGGQERCISVALAEQRVELQ